MNPLKFTFIHLQSALIASVLWAVILLLNEPQSSLDKLATLGTGVVTMTAIAVLLSIPYMIIMYATLYQGRSADDKILLNRRILRRHFMLCAAYLVVPILFGVFSMDDLSGFGLLSLIILIYAVCGTLHLVYRIR